MPMISMWLEGAKAQRTTEEMAQMAQAAGVYQIQQNGATAASVSVLQPMYGHTVGVNVYGGGYALEATGNLSTVSTAIPNGVVPNAPFTTSDGHGNVTVSAPIDYGLASDVLYENSNLYSTH